ncbi:MAG: hypothetical protein RL007_1733 [Bacteroidota bacterium]
MRTLFYLALIVWIAFEILKSYLILPFPGSQQSDAVDLAWFLHHYRWVFRIVLLAGMLFGVKSAFAKRKWIPAVLLFLTSVIVYFTNFVATAENMFHPPKQLSFSVDGNKLPDDAIVVAVSNGNTHRAYPVRYIAFHHQVYDTLNGKRLLITYCDVCRSAMVFDPQVNGKQEIFRLVGMDQFNAMLEDSETGSWWRQATGECAAGTMKGEQLQTWPFSQMTFEEFQERFPDGLVMNPATEDAEFYDADGSFEKGKDIDPLTATDTASWNDKSWIIGISYKSCARAYDWNELKKMRVIHDTLCGTEIVVGIDSNNVDYFAYKVNQQRWIPQSLDTLTSGWDFRPGFNNLEPLQARQMFWHTWHTFYPNATHYKNRFTLGNTSK